MYGKDGNCGRSHTGKGAHKLTLSNRRTAGITGVSDVISFDISEVLLETDMGMPQDPGSRPSCESADAGKRRDRSGGKDRQHPVFGSVRLQKGGETLLNRLFR